MNAQCIGSLFTAGRPGTFSALHPPAEARMVLSNAGVVSVELSGGDGGAAFLRVLPFLRVWMAAVSFAAPEMSH